MCRTAGFGGAVPLTPLSSFCHRASPRVKLAHSIRKRGGDALRGSLAERDVQRSHASANFDGRPLVGFRHLHQ
jgi:hypothetical protein